MQAFQQTQLVRRHHRRRINRQKKKNLPLRQTGKVLGGLLLAALTLLALGAGMGAYSLLSSLPDVTLLPAMLDKEQGTLLQPTRLYDRSGEHLLLALENPGIERRFLPLDPVHPDALSPKLAQGVVILFEPDYLKTPDLDVFDLFAERPPTLAERLTTNTLLPSLEPSKLERLRLRLTAAQVQARYGRAQVLEWYLNSTAFGHFTFGADSAARLYLGKSASQLEWHETALLIAAIEKPALNPLDTPAAAHEEQMNVMARLAASGVIGLEELETARSLPIHFPEKPQPQETAAAAFTKLALGQLASDPGSQILERGGLRITTSLDFELQQQLECTILGQLTRLTESGGGGPALPCAAAELLPQLPLTSVSPAVRSPLAASGAVLDPLTGQVLALTGDLTLTGGESTAASHPSGSLQGPLLALAGFARGLSPATLVWDIPSDPTDESAIGKYHGPVRLRTALANDYLAGLNQVLEQVGADALSVTARLLGVGQYNLPHAGSDVLQHGALLTPLDAAYAFAPFSTLGIQAGVESKDGKLTPQLVLGVENHADSINGGDIQGASRPVVSQQLAFLVHDILSDEPARWPSLKQPNPLAISEPAGAKTGSADGGQSTWAAGYTRHTVAAIWLGYAQDAPEASPLDVRYAAGIWHAMMTYQSGGQAPSGWEMPPGMTLREVCNPSGLLPTAECPNVVTELFISGHEPSRTDDLYQRFEINRETGKLATAFTPLELVEERVFLVAPPEAQDWSRAANLPVPPRDYDTVQLPQPDAAVHISSPEQFSYVKGRIKLTGTAAGEGFSSYTLQLGRGINPADWQTVGDLSTTPVEDGLLGEIDTTRLTDGLYLVRLQVVQQDTRLHSSLLQITVDNTPPSAAMPYPLPGQIFPGNLPRTITLQAEAVDAVGLVRVEFWADDRMIGERFSAPYALIWDAPVGDHTLQLRAVDLAGNETWSDEVKVEVQ